jgi:hypothetical protein
MRGRALGAGKSPGAAVLDEHGNAAQNTRPEQSPQVLDIDGRLLRPRRHAWVPGALRRAVPGWVKWSVDRWQECGQ